MNMTAQFKATDGDPPAFLAAGLDTLAADANRAVAIHRALKALEGLTDDKSQKTVRGLRRRLSEIEPNVTMIGQIKSGKTTLINAMIGRDGLLPADINPWTSVVTTVHLKPGLPKEDETAVFDFFEDGEWDRLMRSGGRLGELAQRAGADEQVTKVRQQIEAMREKSKARLGRKFEMLLGQSHRYGYVDAALIQRYVCLGDDFDTAADTTDQTGQFADITKSAQLTLSAPHLPMPFGIRDTPGINDTFMMREQITLQSIRDSRICVVVLSAHQALSTDDLALIRLITNARSRDVVIFINRIDELQDPLRQVEQIKNSIRDTLLVHRAPVAIELIFGSAKWASAAVKGDIGHLTAENKAALLNWAKSPENRPPAHLSPLDMFWHLSGVPQLNAVIAARMSETVVAEERAEIVRRGQNIADAVRAKDNFEERRKAAQSKLSYDAGALTAQITQLARTCETAYREAFDAVFEGFEHRLDRACDGFLTRATDALITHLNESGEETAWSYDPTGLRILLASAYRSFERNYIKMWEELLSSTADDLAQHVAQAIGIGRDMIPIRPPAPIRIPPPISIGQTIALDLKSSWWQSWWSKRRGYASETDRFRALIEAEVSPVLQSLLADVRDGVGDAGASLLSEFLNEQCRQWAEMGSDADKSANALAGALDLPTLQKRDATLTRILTVLEDATT